MTAAAGKGKRVREEPHDEPATDGLTVLHRARMLPWSVSAVTALAACPDGSVFAAGYEDGKVEVFDAAVYNRLALIPGADGQEITSLAWARTPTDTCWRLFASTLAGTIMELSCQQLQPLATTDSAGGAVWCLRAAPCTTSTSSSTATTGSTQQQQGGGGLLSTTQLAAACSDGSVKLFNISSRDEGQPGVTFSRALPRVKGNALSLAWHPNGRSLVSGGSDGCMHVWDLQTGTEQQRITAGTSSTSPPCVWALEVLADGTIVSGDQEGAVQFWDGRFGTLLTRHQQFAADVLTLAASPDGKMVWASGVDPKVALYQSVPDKTTGVARWMYLDRKQPHSHDIRALTALQPTDSDALLVSGGNDGQIMLYNMPNFLKQHPYRQSKAPQRPLLQMSQGVRPALLMQVQQRQVQLWQLGQAAAAQQQLAGESLSSAAPMEGERWDLAALPSLLATITTSSSSHIITAALAPDGSAVAAADRHKLRLFKVQKNVAATQASQQQQQQEAAAAAAGVAVSRVKVEQRQLDAPVVCCCFSADSTMLFAVTGTGRVVAVDVATGEVLAAQQLTAGSSNSAGGGGGKQGGGQKQQQQQHNKQQGWCSSLAWAMPRASVAAASRDGKLLAVATAAGVELLSAAGAGAAGGGSASSSLLQPLRQLSLLGEPSAVTAVQFNATSRVVAVATAANTLAAYDVDSGLPTQWSLQHEEVAGELMAKLPGSIAGLSFRPQAGPQDKALSLLTFSAGGLAHLDLAQPLLAQQDGLQQYGGGAAGMSSKQRRKQRQQQGPAALRVDPASESGRNGRLLKLEDSCLLVGHCSSSEVVLLEKPWQQVLQALLPPVYRHRYGA